MNTERPQMNAGKQEVPTRDQISSIACVWCGAAMNFNPVGGRPAAVLRIAEHAQECPCNPLAVQVRALEEANLKLLEEASDLRQELGEARAARSVAVAEMDSLRDILQKYTEQAQRLQKTEGELGRSRTG